MTDSARRARSAVLLVSGFRSRYRLPWVAPAISASGTTYIAIIRRLWQVITLGSTPFGLAIAGLNSLGDENLRLGSLLTWERP
ncbi:MAG: hypothetical protein ABR529_11935, partial [Actinomycetota bacterium]